MASALAVALMRACWHDQPTLSVKRKRKGLKKGRTNIGAHWIEVGSAGCTIITSNFRRSCSKGG